MREFNYFVYGLISFSVTQILGILFKGYSLNQVAIIYFLACLLFSIPGFIRWGMLQRTQASKLPNQHIMACFVPSIIGIVILTTGFVIGVYVV